MPASASARAGDLAPGSNARIRKKLGLATGERKNTAGYFKLDYHGARFSRGYPARPDMEDRRKVTELPKPEPMIRNSSCVLIGTGRYCEMSLAQISENLIGECFDAAFGCHCHSGFGWFQGL